MITLLMASLFSHTIFAAAPRSVWCGEPITFDAQVNVEQLLTENQPQYFETAKFLSRFERAKPWTRYDFSKPQHVISVRGWLAGKQLKHFRFEPAMNSVDWNGHEVETALIMPTASPWEDPRIAVLLENGALIFNEDLNSVILCRQYHSHESFDNVVPFLKALPGKISDLVDAVRPVLDSIPCGEVLEGNWFKP